MKRFVILVTVYNGNPVPDTSCVGVFESEYELQSFEESCRSIAARRKLNLALPGMTPGIRTGDMLLLTPFDFFAKLERM